MDSITVEVAFPQELLVALNIPVDQVGQKTIEWIVLELYREGVISSGKAAELLGMTKGYFIDFLHQRNIPYLNWSDDELAREVDVAVAAITTTKE